MGIYISVPFCRSKCSYCNFATGVVSRALYARYVDRVCADMTRAQATARQVGGEFERSVDSVFFGGGTPTILEPADLEKMFRVLRPVPPSVKLPTLMIGTSTLVILPRLLS